ncbi:MAG: HEAT repeat domain-containing protein, partial [Bradymonadia bacterium]
MSSFEADALIETALYAVSPLDRDAARTELIRRPTHQQTKWLIALLDAPSKLVRRRAVRLLGDINPSHIRPFIQTIFSEVDSSSRVVVALARMLSAQTKDAEPLLSIGLESPDPKVRLACATRAAPEAALINGLLDESVEVRNKCAHCLNEREKTIDPDVLTRLVTLIGPKEEQCLILIARANPEHPILADMSHMGMRYLDFARNPIQIERHEHSSPIQKSWALSRLRSLPTEAALHPNPEIRAAFARACMSDAAALDRLCEDQDPVVRWMARRAKSGAFDPTTIEQRLAPHSRLDAPSAKPPYGIKPGDEKIGTQRIKAALAL